MAGEGTKRIIDLTEAAETQSGDYIAIDSTGRGTRKLPAGFMATAEDLSEEQTERRTADATLDGKITAEAQARLDADNALGDQITALNEKTEADAALIQNPTKTLSGALCSFTDGADMPMVACTAEIVPKQSGTGTPSPENVRPISGWDSVNLYKIGVNVWDEEWELGSYNSETGAKVNNTTRIRTTNKIPCKGGATYYFKVGVNSTYGTMCYYDASETFIGSYSYTGNATFTPPSNACYCAWTILNYGTTYNNDISINYPSTDTEYHAYNPNSSTTTTPLGRTVYGGTLDVVSGVLTVTHAMATLNGTETWHIASDFAYTYPTGMKSGTAQTGWCSIAPTASGVTAYGAMFGSGNTALYIGKALSTWNVSSVAEIQAYLANNPMQIVYPLATPQTYTLTGQEIDTLLGDNNVWADSGDVEITYRRDISIVINNLESALNG